MNASKFQRGSANDAEISHSAKKTGKWIYILKETLCIRVCLSKEDIHTFTQRKCSITVLDKQKDEWQLTDKWRMWAHWVQQHSSQRGSSVRLFTNPSQFFYLAEIHLQKGQKIQLRAIEFGVELKMREWGEKKSQVFF